VQEADEKAAGADGEQELGLSQETKPAPPLPARPPRTPVMTKSTGGGVGLDGEKAFLPMPKRGAEAAEGDAEAETETETETWEARTWKQVISLKEAMWRARVGVVDDGAE
jgi:hypothetical protein